ncbi:citramalate synthase [Parasphaerochaeta coccoides]|uniref:Citramalate synthase n=1 Tax=Parasphaerochaeta coccoides (strain ATCC BAA-1237 / DSM 17374 / SPN1) TaxID=760011 RepID=F4GH78_PARC1|nr:citramalate synthase [Parasphaerochaeta coccoides]AEC01553.1 2-isopropylmalate synthase [Parasphaerochaeta coccoides DSM 17374]
MAEKAKIDLFDSTLRDGSQALGISFSVSDKIRIVELLDELGVAWIEAGNPGSNPKDLEFFRKVAAMQLSCARLVAFGATRRKDSSCADDPNMAALLEAGTDAVAIFGKSWDFHVKEILHATKDENLKMIGDTIAWFKEKGKTVIFDAEHFFDGHASDPAYAMACLETARDAGADVLVLCETRGGALPWEVERVTRIVVERFPGIPIGIHAHDDGGMAVANSLVSVNAGATHVQGTLLGFGERCGNANLSTIAADLALKMDRDVLNGKSLERLYTLCRAVAEVSNVSVPSGTPYIGDGAFAHKGGMHIDGVLKNPASFEHVQPAAVGNERRLLTSEVAGRALIFRALQRIAPYVDRNDERTSALVGTLKTLEAEGYQFEGAESSFELVIKRNFGSWHPYFNLVHYQTTGNHPVADPHSPETHMAVVKVSVNGSAGIAAAEGAGPVNALDKALRKVLESFYPSLRSVHLTDYKVRVLDSRSATASKVRVLIESSDGERNWTTVGVSRDIIQASWLALSDSIEYKLMSDGIVPPTEHTAHGA